MSSEFAREVLLAVRDEGLQRIKGGLLSRILWSGARMPFYTGHRGHTAAYHHRDAGLRFSRASYMTAITEEADSWSPPERLAWMESKTLPAGFWGRVDERARSWDALR